MSPSILLSPALISALAAPAEEPEPAPAPALESAHGPALGLQVRSVGVDTGTEQYALTPRVWSDVVAENPSLLRDQRRAELFAPGLAGVGLGSVWLVIATSVAVDEALVARRNGGDEGRLFSEDQGLSATQVTFRFVIPSAILITGAVLTSMGGRARRRIDRAQDALYLGPQLSEGGGGMSVGGRF